MRKIIHTFAYLLPYTLIVGIYAMTLIQQEIPRNSQPSEATVESGIGSNSYHIIHAVYREDLPEYYSTAIVAQNQPLATKTEDLIMEYKGYFPTDQTDKAALTETYLCLGNSPIKSTSLACSLPDLPSACIGFERVIK